MLISLSRRILHEFSENQEPGARFDIDSRILIVPRNTGRGRIMGQYPVFLVDYERTYV